MATRVHIIPTSSSCRGSTQDGRRHPDTETLRQAVHKIELWWLSLKNKEIFNTIKCTLCAAENSLTYDILRKLSPREATLLCDPAIRAKVKFRLGGDQFPPVVLFKIFISQQPIQYISGRNMISATSEAAQDAKRQMGNRLYYDVMLSDACHHYQCAITDAIDVSNIKDYMKYSATVDESPAYLGGRENFWRKLTLDVLPRHTPIYNILELLSCQPKDISLHKLHSISQLYRESTTSPVVMTSSHSQKKSLSSNARRERGSHIAQHRVKKMKKLYELATLEHTQGEQNGGSDDKDSDIDDELLLQEVDGLYQWSQDLSYDDIHNS